MTPVIAIVGRPNVGKSTLYNRLARSRDALVADRPGVTRDRRYGFAIHGDRRYILIDTGGLGREAAEDRDLAALISEQAMKAVGEADAVLWLVDARAGPTPADQDLAAQLRPRCRRLHLVVNKAEGMDPHTAVSEFFSLGVGQPIAVSAEHGDGVRPLIGRVLKDFPDTGDQPVQVSEGPRISVIGRPNVGKSTLINRLLGEDRMLTFEHPGTTRDSIEVPFERRGRQYTLIDTAGVRRRARIIDKVEKFGVIKSLRAIEDSSIVLAVIDAREGLTEQDLTLLGLASESGKSLIVAVNKWDGLAPDRRTKVRGQLERKLGFIEYALVQYISALHGTGVGRLFDAFDAITTSQSTRPSSAAVTGMLLEAQDAHPPPLVRGRRIKLRYAHVGGHDPLRIIIHGNQTERVPASYRRYLANALRGALRLTATPVVIEFKRGENPFRGRKNPLTKRQRIKRKRMVRNRKER